MGRAKRKKERDEGAVPARAREGTRTPWIVAGLGFALGVGGVAVLVPRRGADAPPAAASTAAEGGPTRGARSPEAARQLDVARQHLEREELAAAQAALEKAAALAPEDVDVAFLMGDVAYRGYRMHAAEKHYRRAAELDPGIATTHANLALVLLELGQAREAVSAARRALAVKPGDPRFEALLGQALLRAGEAGEAAALLEKAVKAGVDDADKLAALGRARDLKGDREGALQAFDESLRRDPHQSVTHYWRAECLRRLGRAADADRALASYRRGLDLQSRVARVELRLAGHPDDVDALLELALLRLERGLPQQAVVPVMRAEALAPTHPRLPGVRERVRRALDVPGGRATAP